MPLSDCPSFSIIRGEILPERPPISAFPVCHPVFPEPICTTLSPSTIHFLQVHQDSQFLIQLDQFLFKNYLVCVCVLQNCMTVRGQSSRLPPCGSQGLSSGHETWWYGGKHLPHRAMSTVSCSNFLTTRENSDSSSLTQPLPCLPPRASWVTFVLLILFLSVSLM